MFKTFLGVFGLTAALVAFSAHAQQTSLETRVLAQFDAHCGTLDSVDGLTARIEAAGWQRFKPEAESDLGVLLDYYNVNRPSPDFKVENWAFARGGDREIVVVVTRTTVSKATMLECRSMAIQARQRPAAATIERWAGKPATRKIDQYGAMIWQWEPGLRPTHAETSFAYVEPDSPVTKQLPVRGMIAMATQ